MPEENNSLNQDLLPKREPTSESLISEQKKEDRKTSYTLVIIISIVVSMVVTILVWFFLNTTMSFFKTEGDSIIPGLQEQITGESSETKNVVVKEESAVIDAVKKVQPAVVSIIATKDLQSYYQGNPFYNDPFFNQFFGPSYYDTPQNQPDNNGDTEKTKVGGGTGFFISSDGLVLTNKHVIADETADYTVVDNEGNEYPAQILAQDPFVDIAVMKVEGDNFPVVELGDSEQLEPGQTVVAIGNSLGEYSNSVTKGVISGINRSITAGDQNGNSTINENVIQTDAAINPGNSGGPLVNIDGQVIGINTAIDISGQLVGFAIPINDAKDAVDSVKENGKISKPYIGIRYTPITPEIAKSNNLPVDYGVLVSRGQNPGDLAVVPGGPADKSGIVENDIILEYNGQKIDQKNDLSKMIQGSKVGDEVELKIWHRGEEKTVKVKLAERTQ